MANNFYLLNRCIDGRYHNFFCLSEENTNIISVIYLLVANSHVFVLILRLSWTKSHDLLVGRSILDL